MPTVFRCVWMFALFGPVFGYMTVMALFTVASARTFIDLLKFPVIVVLASMVGLPFAWVAGTVPAILVAFVYWGLRAKLTLSIMPATALSAMAAIVVCAGGIVIIDGNTSTLRLFESWLTIMLPGVVATLLCVVLVEHRRPR